MAAGDAFTLVPEAVVTLEPEYNTVESQTESMKKEHYEISSTPVERYRLIFEALTDSERDTLLDHFKDQSGGYYAFSWQSVPNYIGSGANITGRWVKGSLTMNPLNPYWKCSIEFEKEN